MTLPLARLWELEADDSINGKAVRRMLAPEGGYERCVDVLERDLSDIMERIEQNRADRARDSEDAISRLLTQFLAGLGYDATHEEFNNGHVDIVVKWRDKGYRWLAEAKIYDGCKYLLEGIEQLVGYATGAAHQDRGALLVYGRQKDMAGKIREWRTRLDSMQGKFSLSDCPHREELGFVSVHTHPVSGRPYTIWHVALMLYVPPAQS